MAIRLPALRHICPATALVFCSTAHAQSQVTLFGMADVAMLYTSRTLDSVHGTNMGKQFSMIDGGAYYSQFGLMGTEDLGGGIKANFRLQSAFSSPTGSLLHCNGNFFGCEAWVGLSGSSGEVKLGLQFSPFFYAVFETDPRSLSLFGSGSIPLVTNVLGTGIFNANSVSYTSPTIAGFTASGLYAFGGQPGDFLAGRQYSVRFRYQLENLTINAAMYSGNSGGTVDTPIPTTVEYEGRIIGAGYQFETLTLKASYVMYKVAGSFNNHVYGGGFSWMTTPFLELNGGAWFTSDRNHTANHSILAAVGANYLLSQSTALYVQVGMVNNHGAMNTGLSMVGALYEVPGTSIGAVAGLRKSF